METESESQYDFSGDSDESKDGEQQETRTADDINSCILFVKNLTPEMDDDELSDLFEEYGKIKSATIIVDELTCTSKGYGFVRFESHEAACNAVNKANGKIVHGKALKVKKYMNWKEREKLVETQKEAFTNIYVGNFGKTMSEEMFKDLFNSFGNISSLKIERNDDGSSKGFGFINFQDHESAVEAIKAMNGERWNGNPLIVNRAQTKADRECELKRIAKERSGRNLIIKNLHRNITEKKLFSVFKPFGKIESLKINTKNNIPKGYVCYSTVEEAQEALKKMNNRTVMSRPLKIVISEIQFGELSNSELNVDGIKAEDDENLLTLAELEKKTRKEQKNLLGERIFPVAEVIYPQLAGKITGMLLEMDNSELVQLVNNEKLLKNKIIEAAIIFVKHQATNNENNTILATAEDENSELYRGVFTPTTSFLLLLIFFVNIIDYFKIL